MQRSAQENEAARIPIHSVCVLYVILSDTIGGADAINNDDAAW